MHDDTPQASSALADLDRPVDVPAVFHDRLLAELEQRLQQRPGHVRVPHVPAVATRDSAAGLRRGFAIASGVAVLVAVLGLSLGFLTRRAVDDDDTNSAQTTLAAVTTGAPTSTAANPAAPVVPSDPGPAAPIPDGWSMLDSGPVSSIGAGAVTQTGPGSSTGIAVWAGDAAWYEVESRVWRDLGSPPVPWSEDAQLLATGEGMVAIAATGEIAVLDSRTRQWGPAAPRPEAVRHLVDTVWNEEVLYLLAHTQAQARLADELVLVSYDPVEDVWRELAAPSLNLSYADLSWTGDRLIIYGGFLDSNNWPRDPSGFARGAVYDPASDTWEDLPTVALSPNAVTSVWAGDHLIAWDYLHAIAAYRPDTGWSPLPPPPLDFSECYPDSAWTGEAFFAWYCGAAALYSPDAGTWQLVQTPAESTALGSESAVRGDPVSADGSVYFWGARYNSDGVSFWRFDPSGATPGTGEPDESAPPSLSADTAEVPLAEPVPFQLFAIERIAGRDFAATIIDGEARTATKYELGEHQLQADVIDFVAPFRDGWITVAHGSVWLHGDQLDGQPRVIDAQPLRTVSGIAPAVYTIEASDAADGALWIVDIGPTASEPTVVRYRRGATFSLVTEVELPPSTFPVVADGDRLLLNSEGPSGQTTMYIVSSDGTVDELWEGAGLHIMDGRVVWLDCEGTRCSVRSTGINTPSQLAPDEYLFAPADGYTYAALHQPGTAAVSPSSRWLIVSRRHLETGGNELVLLDLLETETVLFTGDVGFGTPFGPKVAWSADSRWVLLDGDDVQAIAIADRRVVDLQPALPSDTWVFAVRS